MRLYGPPYPSGTTGPEPHNILLLIGKKSSISGSIAKDNHRYSPHGTTAGVHSNELEGVAFTSLTDFTGGLHSYLLADLTFFCDSLTAFWLVGSLAKLAAWC